MAAAAREIAENTKIEKWDDDRARDWLFRQAEISGDSSFVVTTRNLAALWGWSKAGVSNLLKSMKMAGILSHEVLPNNGGTRLTIVGQGHDSVVRLPVPMRSQAVKNDSGSDESGKRDIESIQVRPSKSLTDKLAIAYHGIIYDKPGFEHCGVEHLELIEQALFPDICPSFQQAA